MTERDYNTIKVSSYLWGVKKTYKSFFFQQTNFGVTKDVVRRIYGMKGPFALM